MSQQTEIKSMLSYPMREMRFLPTLADRGPLRVMFLITSMPIGGAETLLVNLVRRLDRTRFQPELCCLKELGPLGEELSREIPAHSQLLSRKYDFGVLGRLTRLFKARRIDAVVTVGAGDKMFWGRLAARRAGLPVVLSAIHSTGWPDGVNWLNRQLTPITDAFIAVAEKHGQHLVEQERFPREKVRVIPNGVDIQRFRPNPEARTTLRCELGLSPDTPVCGIVAALRPEKNHELFLRVAHQVSQRVPAARFLIVGDGPTRPAIESRARQLDLSGKVFFLGSRSDIPAVLSAMDVFALTSHNEANPVSILEAMATGLPVIATKVGSVAESVVDHVTGRLVPPGAVDDMAACWQALLNDDETRLIMGEAGRNRVVQRWSLETMVRGYEDLIAEVYERKATRTTVDAEAHPVCETVSH
jgi:glycosyltransferase involved in cell wall biosynthesis